jgi:hypothetical protein
LNKTLHFKKEDNFRKWLQQELAKLLNGRALVLESKNVNDIVICKETSTGPVAFFIEVKYETERSGRIGIGNSEGHGFQTEILIKKPRYFELYTRWLIAADDGWAVLATNEEVRSNASGGYIRYGKQNNIKDSIFTNKSFRINEVPNKIEEWITSVT